ncbi:MAG: hypothetical protein ACFFAH_01845 [Promethearchaeota archaeon]
MTQVRIRCPTCGKYGNIEISLDLLKNTQRGLLSVNIANNIICPHQFLAYVDKTLQVRDYFTVDFHVDIPEISSIEKIKEPILPSKEIIDIDLIKLNINAMLLTYVIKSIFLKQKIVLIMDQEFLFNHIKNFFRYITQDCFKTDVKIIKSDDYKNNKKSYKDAMVFENNKIIRNNKNLINLKKLSVEKNIVNKFFSENDLGYSYIVLKNELIKTYELAKRIKEYVEQEHQKGEKPNVLKIKDELEEIYKIKISNIYLTFLIEITASYFKISVPSLINGFFEFL